MSVDSLSVTDVFGMKSSPVKRMPQRCHKAAVTRLSVFSDICSIIHQNLKRRHQGLHYESDCIFYAACPKKDVQIA